MKTLKKCIPFVLAAVMSMCVFAGCISGFIESELPKHTTFSAAEGSKKITGALKIYGKEITLPYTVAELKSKGFNTDNKNDYELNGISFGMTEDEFIKLLGKPAYERDYGPQGYGRYYEGTNDSVYRFLFKGDKTLWSVMIATPEYIDWEINYLYHS